MLTITRESGYADKLRNYRVVLDGEIIGKIADGQTKSFEIEEGTHTLRIEVDWAKSNEITFEYSDKNIKFKCANALKGPKVFLVIFYATFLSHKYIKLEQIGQSG